MSQIPIYNELSKYLYNFGICSLSTSKQIFNGMTEFHDHLAIFSIKNFLDHLKYSNNQVNDVATQLFDKYVQNDDKNIRKIIRKLFIIYSHSRKDLLQKYLLKWKNISSEISWKLMKNKANKRNNNSKIDNSNKKNNSVYNSNNISNNAINFNNMMNYQSANIDLNYDNYYNENNNDYDNYYSYNNENEDLNNYIYQSRDYCNNLNINLPNNLKEINNSKYNSKKNSQRSNLKNLTKSTTKYNSKSNSVTNFIPNSSTNSVLIPSKSMKTSVLSTIQNNLNNYIQYNVYEPEKNNSKGKNKQQKSDKPKRWNYSYKKVKEIDDYYLNSTKTEFNQNRRRNLSLKERREFFNNLSLDRQNRKEKLMKMKMEKEAKFNETYTFEPKIISNRMNKKYMQNFTEANNRMLGREENNFTETPNSPHTANNDIPSFLNRLKQYEKNKEQKMKQIEEEIKITPPQPKYFNKKLNLLESHLIFLSKNFNQEKQKKLDKITENYIIENGITFEPETNKMYNEKIKSNFIERNNEFIKEKDERIANKSSTTEKECTFTPEINKNITIKTNGDVINRMMFYQKRHEELLDEIKNRYKENYSFKPEITKKDFSVMFKV